MPDTDTLNARVAAALGVQTEWPEHRYTGGMNTHCSHCGRRTFNNRGVLLDNAGPCRVDPPDYQHAPEDSPLVAAMLAHWLSAPMRSIESRRDGVCCWQHTHRERHLHVMGVTDYRDMLMVSEAPTIARALAQAIAEEAERG